MRSSASSVKRRLTLGITALAVVPLGLFLRFLPLGLFADVAGGALYAVLIYLLLGVLAPATSAWRLGALALAWCWAVEFLQLTMLPAMWAAQLPVLRLVFGTGFASWDLLAYTFGILLVVIFDQLLVRNYTRAKQLS